MPKLRMNQAIVAALTDEMRDDPSVVVFGEDVAVAGGPFKTSDGLLDEFGPLRVRDTPISEMAFMGMAVGAAATGLRPVAEIMFIEFLGVALDQLTTEGAFFHYLSGGRLRVPMTMRASVGAGLGFGLQHSRTLEQWLMGTPGLKVVSPSDPQSAYGLLRAAVRDDNPVAVLEPRVLYASRGEVTTGMDGIISLGQARTVASGDDVTLVTLGQTTGIALDALDRASFSADVIDLCSLVPWDRDTVVESVARTRRLVVVEQSPWSGGWGTEITSYVTAELFGDLVAPPVRITCPDVPVPFNKELEARYLPTPGEVRRQTNELIDTGQRPLAWWQRSTDEHA